MEKCNSVIVKKVSGKLDYTMLPSVRAALDKYKNTGTLIVDFSEVSYAGIPVLHEFASRSNVEIVGTTPYIEKIFNTIRYNLSFK